MRYLRLAFASVVTASFLAACGGGAPSVPGGSTLSQAASVPLRSKLPKFLRLAHTPPRPPAKRHQITSAMRARARAGGWEPLSAAPPAFSNGAGTELLLTDGSVLVQDYCTPNWFRLTPDQTGSYVNGTWSEIASMPSDYGPLYFASAVLPDGKVMVNGGEYNISCSPILETSLGAIYDPVANKWTAVAPPSGWSEIGDGQSVVLPDGTYMLGNCCQSVQAVLNETSMSWTQVGNGKSDPNSEEGWTLLKNGKVLATDVFGEPNSELYNPSTSGWSSAGTVPVNLTQEDEIGPQTMMPNNVVFVSGADQNTALYDATKGKWTQGPTFPTLNGRQLDIADGPSSVLTDGTVLLATSADVYSSPVQMLLFNGKKFQMMPNFPDAPNDSSYFVRLIMLPTGQVLETDGSTDIEVYSANRKTVKGIAPDIKSVPATLVTNSTYTISGKRFNGSTQNNFYGDDDQQATNYPLVRITSATSGKVFYARTHGHSYMGIGSNKPVSTMFDVPANVPAGAATVQVVTNGIASRAVNVTIDTSR